MKQKLQRGFTLIELLVVITIIAILASLAVPTFNAVQDMANQNSAANNCRQIIMAMKLFAADNNGIYPDSYTNPITGGVAVTANDAFRTLIQEDIIQDERIFGCKASKFNPDGNIGLAPGFAQALQAGENHWALTQGQSSSSSGIMPLVYENPVAIGWPPQWNADVSGQPVQGRTWRGGKVIIGLNDNSVQTVALAAKRGSQVAPKVMAGGQDMFTMASQGNPQNILNIVAAGSGSYTNDPNAQAPLGGYAPLPGGAAPGGFAPLPGGAPAPLPAPAPAPLPAPLPPQQ